MVDFYFLKVHLNFALTVKTKKKKPNNEFAKRSWGQQSRGIIDIIAKSAQQSNWIEVGAGVGVVLKLMAL